jgi:hypothetical protein
MVELHPVDSRRRAAPATALLSLTALSLCASALPTGAAVAAPSGAVGAVPAQQVQPSGQTVLEAIDVPTVAQEKVRSARTGERLVAELPRTATATFSMIGVTWQTGTSAPDTEVQVAFRVDNTWSGFEELHAADEPGSSAGEDVRAGTEPLWVDEADGVAVRVISSGRTPEDLEVTTVQPDRADAALAAKASSASAGAAITAAVRFPTMPDVMTRREWGADPDLGDTCWAPRFGRSARAVVVHHTVNSNDYSRADGPAIVRSILAYHTQGQGWCDIGYNYLVDRFGRVYEGRAGGIRRPVRGAHAGDYNTDTVGISMIGDYDKARLPRALKNAMVRLVGWRLGTSYTRIYGKTRIYDRRVPHILGHRDVMSTACPGRYGYAFIPALRRQVASYLSKYTSGIREHAAELGRDTTGPVFVGEIRRRSGHATRFVNGRMLHKPGLGAHWVAGRPLNVYRRQGGAGGVLGYPRTDLEPTGIGSTSRMLFERGALYQRRNWRPHVLYGRVRVRWIKLGGLGGPLGAPLTSLASDAARDTAKFQHGRITWYKSANEVVVKRS